MKVYCLLETSLIVTNITKITDLSDLMISFNLTDLVKDDTLSPKKGF